MFRKIYPTLLYLPDTDYALEFDMDVVTESPDNPTRWARGG